MGLITLAQFPGNEMSPGLFQDFKTLRLSPLVAEYSVVVMSARLNPMGSQFSIPVLWNLFRVSCGINCRDPVEDSGIGGRSSITVRMEYLCAFQY